MTQKQTNSWGKVKCMKKENGDEKQTKVIFKRFELGLL